MSTVVLVLLQGSEWFIAHSTRRPLHKELVPSFVAVVVESSNLKFDLFIAWEKLGD